MTALQMEDKRHDDPSRVAEEYWIRRASERPPEEAVHPKSRFLSYEMWTRRMVQTWTMQRVRAPRFRRCLDAGISAGTAREPHPDPARVMSYLGDARRT